MEKMTQYGEFGCIFSHNYAFKISHFLHVYKHSYIVSEEGSSNVLHIECVGQGRQTGGGGVGGSQPPLNFRGGVEHLSTPLILRRFILGGGGWLPLN